MGCAAIVERGALVVYSSSSNSRNTFEQMHSRTRSFRNFGSLSLSMWAPPDWMHATRVRHRKERSFMTCRSAPSRTRCSPPRAMHESQRSIIGVSKQPLERECECHRANSSPSTLQQRLLVGESSGWEVFKIFYVFNLQLRCRPFDVPFTSTGARTNRLNSTIRTN